MRQNPQKAAAQQRRDSGGLGPLYRYLLAFETAQDERYRSLGRPRVLLAALQAGETVQVPAWRVPLDLRPPGCEGTVVVAADM